MKTYGIDVSITGKMYIEVEALDEDSAIEKAIEGVEIRHLESWEPTGEAEISQEFEEEESFDPADNGNQGS